MSTIPIQDLPREQTLFNHLIDEHPSAKLPGKRGRKEARDRLMYLQIFFRGIFCCYLLLLMLLNNGLLLLKPRFKASGTGALQDAACDKGGPGHISDLVAFEDVRLTPVLAGGFWARLSAAGATAVQKRRRRLGRVWFRVLTWRLKMFGCKPCCFDPEGSKVSGEGWGGYVI